MTGVPWLRQDGDEIRVDKIDPCEAGTCGHPDHGHLPGNQLERVDPAAVSPADAAPVLREDWQQAEDYLQQALIRLDELATAHPDDAYGLAATLLIANRLRKNAVLLSERVEEVLHGLIPDKQLVIDGIGTVEKGRQSKGTDWDHDAVWRQVRRLLTPAFVDETTGEFDPARAELVEAVLDLVRDLQSPAVWRKTALRARGVEPEGELCESRYGRKTVRIYGSGI